MIFLLKTLEQVNKNLLNREVCKKKVCITCQKPAGVYQESIITSLADHGNVSCRVSCGFSREDGKLAKLYYCDMEDRGTTYPKNGDSN